MAADYLVQEVDGVSRITLEDASGSILLETSGAVAPPPTANVDQTAEIVLVSY